VLRIGIVGTARILPSHLRGMQRLLEAGLADFRVTALVGRTMDGARSFRLRGEGPPPRPPVGSGGDPLAAPHMYVSDLHPDTLPECYPDLDAMLAAGAVDAVLLLTPVGLHHRQAVQCLEAGVHVLCEKPLAVSVRAGRAMVDAARRHGRTLGVAEGVRYDPGVRHQGWAVRAGLLGDVEMVLVGGVGTDAWSPDRIVARTPWRHRKIEAGGGPSLDIGVHQFDHIRAVAGEVVEVSAMTARFAAERFDRDAAGHVLDRVACDVEDTFQALFRLAGGGLGHVAFSWAGQGAPTHWPDSPVIYGSRGVLRGPRFVAPGGDPEALSAYAERTAPAAVREGWFPGGVRDTKALQFLDFLRAAERGADPEASGRQGLADLACAFAILESAVGGRAVSVGDVLEGRVYAYQEEIDAAHGLR
jgi:predicted dehydrogenase